MAKESDTWANRITVQIRPPDPRDKKFLWTAYVFDKTGSHQISMSTSKSVAGLMDGLIPFIEKQHESE